jgi:hypothetical protein
MALDPRKKQIGTRVVEGKGSATTPTPGTSYPAQPRQPAGDPLPQDQSIADTIHSVWRTVSHKEPVFHYMTGAKPGQEGMTTRVAGPGEFRTQDPNIAKAHIANLNDIIAGDDFHRLPPEQQQQIVNARSDAQRQFSEYNQQVRQNLPGYGKPNFPQIDIPSVVKRTGSYLDAAQHVLDTATDGYNSISDALALNDISGGKFNQIRNANKAAWNAYKSAEWGSPKLAEANQAIEETNRQMDDMLNNDIGGAVSQKELSGFNNAYSQGQKLLYIGNAIDKAFSGNPSNAARSWEYRGFNGQALMNNMNGLERKFGRDTLQRIMGRDNLETMYQVAELNRTGVQRARFGAAIKPIAHFLSIHATPMAVGGYVGQHVGVGWEAGAAAGLAASFGSKRVMDAVLSNPRIAQNLIFAVESGSRSENYAPLIGAMIIDAETESKHQQEEEAQQ